MDPCDLEPNEFPVQDLVQACWVDDLVIQLQAETAETLVAKLQTAIALIQDLAVEYGLCLNYGPNKTACVMKLRGNSANAVWHQLLQGAQPPKPRISFVCKSLRQPGHLDIVADYVYLGQLQDQRGHPACEIRRKFLNVKTSSVMLTRNVFRSKHMPFATKATLFRALVVSKLQYGAGAWQAMNIHTARSWHQQFCALLTRIAPTKHRGPHVSNLDILADCNFSHPMFVITSQRLSLFDRLMQSELLELMALLQNQDPAAGWFALVLQDVRKLADQVPQHPLSQPGVVDNIEAIAQYSCQHPKALTKLGKKVQKLYVKSLELWRQFRTFQAEMHQLWDEFSVT